MKFKSLINILLVLLINVRYLNAQNRIAFVKETSLSKWIIINDKGEQLMNRDYKYVFDLFHKITYPLSTHNRQTTIAGYPSEGIFPFFEDMKWGFISKDGKVKVKPQYNFVYNYKSNFAIILDDDHTYNFIDTTGNLLTKDGFISAYAFEGDYALVMNKNWNYLNKKGELLHPKGFEEAYDFHNGLARVKLKGRWGFINN